MRDAIEMTKIADPGYFGGGPSAGRVATFSPDGSNFVVALRRGDVTSNANRYSLLFWETAAALRGGSPRTLLEMDAATNLGGISAIVWKDNETLLFLGERRGEEQQVHELNVASGESKALTHHPTGIRSFSRAGSSLAYLAEHSFKSMWDDRSEREGVVVSGQSVPDLMTGRSGYRFRGLEDEYELFVQDGSGTRRVATKRHLAFSSNPRLSPDARFVVVSVRLPIQELPAEWRQYAHGAVTHLMQFQTPKGLGPTTESYLQVFELLDLASGQSRTLLNSPAYRAPPAVWAPDGKSVILSQTFLPLEVANSAERERRRSTPVTVEVQVATGELAAVGARCEQALRWDASGELVCRRLLADEAGYEDISFRKEKAGWEELRLPRRPRVLLREDMKTPPRIYVEGGSGTEISLLDLNPQFRDLSFARVEEFSWDWAPGQKLNAGLYFPLEYEPGKRYPLVIQTHAWNPKRFWIDGPWSTAYAAQPLAARGFFVVQVLDQYVPDTYGADGQLREVEKALAIYRTAIDALDARGFVDPRRVGIIGFSHTCFYVKYALAHAPDLFAAAAVAEGEDGGYVQYINRKNNYVDAASLYGGPPLGEHLKAWLDRSPGFNLHKVQAPLRITTLSPRYVVDDWEWFEGLNLLGKPVEMILLHDGTHVLQKPAERMVSQGGNVDWFRFWLKDEEDPDPAKAAQYTRWRKLRDARDRSPGAPNAQRRR